MLREVDDDVGGVVVAATADSELFAGEAGADVGCVDVARQVPLPALDGGEQALAVGGQPYPGEDVLSRACVDGDGQLAQGVAKVGFKLRVVAAAAGVRVQFQVLVPYPPQVVAVDAGIGGLDGFCDEVGPAWAGFEAAGGVALDDADGAQPLLDVGFAVAHLCADFDVVGAFPCGAPGVDGAGGNAEGFGQFFGVDESVHGAHGCGVG